MIKKQSKKHETHPAIVARLRRAEGHLKSIIAMVEDGRSCIEVAQQLHAVEKAMATAKRQHIHDHLQHCLGDGQDTQSIVLEMKTLANYL